MTVTCDRPSSTVLMTANNDLCNIMQESLFGKKEISCTAIGLDRQVVSCCFTCFTANLLVTCLLCKELAAAADGSTHLHTARYVTDGDREVLFLSKDLQITENLSRDVEPDILF